MTLRTRVALAVAGLAALIGAVGAGAASLDRSENASNGPPPGQRYAVTLKWIGDDPSGASRWELYVENTNTSKFINAFGWAPPAGLQVDSITKSQGGACTVSGGQITCYGNIPPAPCANCEGGGMTIDFLGTGFDPVWVPTDYGGYYFNQGWTVGAVTITSTSSGFDLPVCSTGQVSTKRKPCVKAAT